MALKKHTDIIPLKYGQNFNNLDMNEYEIIAVPRHMLCNNMIYINFSKVREPNMY